MDRRESTLSIQVVMQEGKETAREMGDLKSRIIRNTHLFSFEGPDRQLTTPSIRGRLELTARAHAHVICT